MTMIGSIRKRGGKVKPARPWLVQGAAFFAAIVAGVLALCGVWLLVGEGLMAGSPFTYVTAFALGGVVILAEVFALRMLVQADARADEGARTQRSAAWFIYAFAEIVSILGAIYGVQGINERMVAEQNRPLDAAVASAGADVRGAERDLAAFDAATVRGEATYDRESAAAREDRPGFISARGRLLDRKSDYVAEREAAREAIEGRLAAAETRLETARLARAQGAKKMPLWQDLAIAFALLLFKGPAMWASTSRPGRAPSAAPAPIQTPRPAQKAAPQRAGFEAFAPKRAGLFGRRVRRDWAGIIAETNREAIFAMDAAVIAALESQAKRIARWCQSAKAAPHYAMAH